MVGPSVCRSTRKRQRYGLMALKSAIIKIPAQLHAVPDYENEGQAEPRDRLKPSAGWNMETAGIEQ